jgi:phosphoribosyl-dephospho-CoA transferase
VLGYRDLLEAQAESEWEKSAILALLDMALKREPYVSHASDARSLELATIELLHSGPEVSGRLELDKSG